MRGSGQKTMMHLTAKFLIILSIAIPSRGVCSYMDWASIESLIWGATMAGETPWDKTPTDQTIWMVRKHLPEIGLRNEHIFEKKFLQRERLIANAIRQSLVRGLRVSKVLEFQNRLLSPKLKLMRTLMNEGVLVESQNSTLRVKLYNPTAEALLRGLKRIDPKEIEEKLEVFFKARADLVGSDPELDERDLQDEFQFVGQSSFIYIEEPDSERVVGVARVSRMIDFEHDPTRILHLFPNRFLNYIKDKLHNAPEFIRQKFSEDEAKREMQNPNDPDYDTSSLFSLPMERSFNVKKSNFPFRFARHIQLRGRTEYLFELRSLLNQKTFQENLIKLTLTFKRLLTARGIYIERTRKNPEDSKFSEDELDQFVPNLNHPLEDEALYELFQGIDRPYFLKSLLDSVYAAEFALDLKRMWIDFLDTFYWGFDPDGRIRQGKTHIREDLPIEAGKYGFLPEVNQSRKLIANVNLIQALVAAMIHDAKDIVFYD